MKTENGKIIVIAGPTTSGKSALAIKLAKKFNAEIISADSRQVYKGLDIGSGKVTKKEMAGVPHYLLDVANPKRKFSAGQFQRLAVKAMNQILKKKKPAIICGGSGFYVQSLIDGLVIPPVLPDWQLRKKLEKQKTAALFLRLKKLDPKRAKNIDRYNRRRLVRALEIVIKSKKPVPALKTISLPYSALKIGIIKNKKTLNRLIKQRLLKRLRQGLVAEVRKLRQNGLSWKRMEELGLEYQYVSLFLRKKLAREEMIEMLTTKIRQFAKRQITWFKRDKQIHWIRNYRQAEKLTKRFLSVN